MLADGRLHLSAIAKLAPHLTAENREALLERAAHRSKRQVEELLAEIAPRPDVPASMRKLPERRVGTLLSSLAATTTERELRPDDVVSSGTGGLVSSEPGRRPQDIPAPIPALAPKPARIEPLALARYKVQFTASAELRDKLERLRALMRSSVPGGDLAAVIETAVTEKLQRLESRRFGRTSLARGKRRTTTGNPSLSAGSGSPSARHIPAAVRRAVYARDGGRCHFVDEEGRRCTAREGLEFHHRRPFAHGGGHSVENVCLACKAHNGYLAEVDYGRKAMAQHRRCRESALELTPPSP